MILNIFTINIYFYELKINFLINNVFKDLVITKKDCLLEKFGITLT